MKIYCAGIGGIGLSAYAALQQANGNDVLGSDRSASVVTEDLEERGIPVFFEQDGFHVPPDADLFVYSEAIAPNAPERLRAEEYGIEQQSYFKALGTLSAPYKVIAVCGTHGKSSTTSMAAKVLVDAGIDPTVVVGTRVPDLDGRNWRKGESDIFLLEACEYRRSFHYLSPDIVLMTNVDGDHFDAYRSIEEYQAAFVEFLKRLPEDGVIVTHGEDPECMAVAKASGRQICAADAKELPTLSVPGRHMQENAQLVQALAHGVLGVEAQTIAQSFREYRGCWRRMELKGQFGEIPVIDDYAHHPKEIVATTQAVKEHHRPTRLVVLYQPHTHERTLQFYDEFTRSFSQSDLLVVTDVYEARKDIERERVDMEKFTADLAKRSSVEVVHQSSIADAETYLRTTLRAGDLLLVMGAGDVTKVAGNLVA